MHHTTRVPTSEQFLLLCTKNPVCQQHKVLGGGLWRPPGGSDSEETGNKVNVKTVSTPNVPKNKLKNKCKSTEINCISLNPMSSKVFKLIYR